MAKSKGAKTTKRHENVAAKSKSVSRQTPSRSIWAVVAVAILFLSGAAATVSQLNLSPVYGSIPASRYHLLGILQVAVLVVANKTQLQQIMPGQSYKWLAVIAWYILPFQYILYRFSSYFGPKYGPIFTETCTYFPLLLFSLAAVDDISELYITQDLSRIVALVTTPLIACLIFMAGKSAADSFLPSLLGNSAFLTRSGLQTMVAVGYTVFAPSKLIVLSALPMVWVALMDPHLPSKGATVRLQKSLNTYNYTLLQRKESLTGYVSVLDSHENDFRVLRCDHSLLGGDWLVTERSRQKGLRRRETVYSVFTMLEAVRLVERQNAIADHSSSALFM